jgi:hypothetical protein
MGKKEKKKKTHFDKILVSLKFEYVCFDAFSGKRYHGTVLVGNICPEVVVGFDCRSYLDTGSGVIETTITRVAVCEMGA